MALSLLARYVREHRGMPDAFPILYVSQSPFLVAYMKRLWQGMFGDSDLVQFKSYGELLTEHMPEAQIAPDEMFDEWYQKYTKKNRKKMSSQKSVLDKDLVWQEFRICSGYSKEQYFKLGKRQSSLEDETRNDIYQAYEAYMAYLEAEHLKSAALYRTRFETADYKIVVVDEAQDLSYGQLDNLYHCAKGNIVCCLGDHQILGDGKSRFPYLRDLLREHSFKELKTTYRCPQRVVDVANKLIDLKLRVTGGTADKAESSMIESANRQSSGVALWMEGIEDEAMEHIRQEARTPHFAVVTRREFVEEAIALFGTELVFTPENIKGLEYQTILVYHLLNNDAAQLANQKLKEVSPQEKPTHRAKAGCDDESCRPWFNQVITAVTRSLNKVIIMEPRHHKIGHLLDELRQVIHPATASAKVDAASTDFNPPTAQPNEIWEEEIERLLVHGHIDKARDIFIKTLKRSPEEFLQLISQTTPDARIKTEAAAMKSPEKKSSPPEKKKAINPLPPNKDEEKVLYLLEHFTEERIIHLLKQRNHLNLLCHVPVVFAKVRSSLLLHIANSVERLIIFAQAMQQDQNLARQLITISLIAKINPQLDLIARNQLFTTLIICYPPIILDKTILAWFKKFISSSLNLCLFHNLTQQENGCAALLLLLEQYPQVIKSIPKNIWTLKEDTDDTPFSNLTVNKIGREFLKKLFIQFPQLIEEIPSESWTTATNSFLSATPIHLLTIDEWGCSLLVHVLIKYPKIIEAIPVDFFWKISELTLNNISAALIPLLGLCQNDSGIVFLQLLLRNHDHFILEILPSMWGQRVSPAKPVTSLLSLVKHPRGQAFLLALLQKHPQIIAQIPSQFWGEVLVIEEDNTSTSVLFLLTLSELGGQFLKVLVENHPEIIGAIPTDAWTNSFNRSESGKISRTNPINALSNNKSFGIMAELYKINPTILISTIIDATNSKPTPPKDLRLPSFHGFFPEANPPKTDTKSDDITHDPAIPS